MLKINIDCDNMSVISGIFCKSVETFCEIFEYNKHVFVLSYYDIYNAIFLYIMASGIESSFQEIIDLFNIKA